MPARGRTRSEPGLICEAHLVASARLCRAGVPTQSPAGAPAVPHSGAALTPSARTTSRIMWPGSVTGSGAQGVLAGSEDAARCIGYLTKQVGDCHHPETDA